MVFEKGFSRKGAEVAKFSLCKGTVFIDCGNFLSSQKLLYRAIDQSVRYFPDTPDPKHFDFAEFDKCFSPPSVFPAQISNQYYWTAFPETLFSDENLRNSKGSLRFVICSSCFVVDRWLFCAVVD